MSGVRRFDAPPYVGCAPSNAYNASIGRGFAATEAIDVMQVDAVGPSGSTALPLLYECVCMNRNHFQDLAEVRIEDVARVVAQLKRDTIDVKVAFWLYTSETDQWFFHIATDLVNQIGITDAYKTVLRSMRQVPDLRIDRFQLKLVPPADATAKAILDFRSTLHVALPTEIRSSNLGGVYIEHAILY